MRDSSGKSTSGTAALLHAASTSVGKLAQGTRPTTGDVRPHRPHAFHPRILPPDAAISRLSLHCAGTAFAGAWQSSPRKKPRKRASTLAVAGHWRNITPLSNHRTDEYMENSAVEKPEPASSSSPAECFRAQVSRCGRWTRGS